MLNNILAVREFPLRFWIPRMENCAIPNPERVERRCTIVWVLNAERRQARKKTGWERKDQIIPTRKHIDIDILLSRNEEYVQNRALKIFWGHTFSPSNLPRNFLFLANC